MKIVGGGVAGVMLAAALHREGLPFMLFTHGPNNAPPVGFVHLFQGRTFQRDPIELQAFQEAIAHWRGEPLASEWSVERQVQPGDRLHRSAGTESVPLEFRPQETSPFTYRYGPGYSVAVQQIMQRECHLFSAQVFSQRVAPNELEGQVVHATGLSIEQLLPDLRWDINPGRTVSAQSDCLPEKMYLRNGCHLARNPQGEGLTIGGRVTSKGEAKNDELILAQEILQAPTTYRSEWWGQRIANALDRWPLVGWLDEHQFVFAGFGGRALFWLPYCCRLAVQALRTEKNDDIPLKLRADRFRTRTKA